MKILHLSLFRKIPSGNAAQLLAESEAAEDLALDAPEIKWTTSALVCEAENFLPGVSQLSPKPFRRIWSATLLLWLRLLRESNNYDIVLLRYPLGDLFAWAFAPFVRNLVTVHHTKEHEELANELSGLRRFVISFAERVLQPIAYRNLLGIVGVTNEIREYELSRFPKVKNSGVFPNGINLDLVSEVPDLRCAPIQVAFIASKFYPWHGLDRLFAMYRDHLEKDSACQPVVHLIGELDEDQVLEAESMNVSGANFKIHGHCTKNEIIDILATCHLALGSLAMDRNKLAEGSTLKVREYLAHGIPVYATHRDAGLPKTFPFFLNDGDPTLASLIEFAESLRAVSRRDVREASERYISKTEILKKLSTELKGWLPGR